MYKHLFSYYDGNQDKLFSEAHIISPFKKDWKKTVCMIQRSNMINGGWCLDNIIIFNSLLTIVKFSNLIILLKIEPFLHVANGSVYIYPIDHKITMQGCTLTQK